MASITLSDNVLNATETATVTFTFDADYALAPANITAIGGTLSTPVAFPARHSRLWQATFTPTTTPTHPPHCTNNPKTFSTAGGRHSFGTSSNGGRTWTYQWWPRVTEGRHPIGIRLYSVKDLA